MRKKNVIFIGILLLLLLGSGKIYFDTNFFKVETITVETEKLAKDQSLTILQISDVHNKVFGEQNDELLEEVFELNPDIIVLTGDLIDRNTDNLDDMFYLADLLANMNPQTFYVSGNHEWDNPLREQFFEGLSERDVQIIDNENQVLDVHGKTIQMAGVADPSTEHDKLDEAIDGLSDQYFTVLLSHAPDMIETNYPDEIDLILSGHTHGGQIRFPLIGALVAPDQGFFPKYDKGLFTLKDNQQLYIDSGIGTSAVPVRLFNQSQMTLIKVEGTAD
ncbi:hypothetical protein SAMN04487944_12815 [Gracilibacillus ureilyticus]|uniref:Calcineurin-like phosphoesterase domain-containing protein n=1 Tax=Gracilibacillus ureilyticus TaxID=531814 RepID=A0A1H9VV94_9BACI|nr:metallophosphoesterase [Gracilibacillus ureilyticus]SES25414.1 hypothetical protein SAMN04487944_12815 [Gracilibacillus ureilyticus]